MNYLWGRVNMMSWIPIGHAEWREFGHSQLRWPKGCSRSRPYLAQLSGGTRRDEVLLWPLSKTGPAPPDSSSTNRLRYANSPGSWQRGETGSCGDVTVCFELVPHVWMCLTWGFYFFVLSNDEGCFTASSSVCARSSATGGVCDGSQEDSDCGASEVIARTLQP